MTRTRPPRLDFRRPPRVCIRPLGREQADGQAHICPSIGHKLHLMEIDPKLRGRMLLETIIHELLHLIFPGMHEGDVRRAGRWIALCLWAWGVRLDEDHFYGLAQERDPEAG